MMERFTTEQIDEIRDAFVMFDKEDLGYIPSHGLRDVLKTIGINPTDRLLEKLLIIIDNDNNGQIDFHEFVDLIDKLHTDEDMEKEARCAFNAFDFMGRGFIAANDIAEALKFVMMSRTDEERSDVLKHFKLHVNRKIYFNEFKDMMTITK